MSFFLAEEVGTKQGVGGKPKKGVDTAVGVGVEARPDSKPGSEARSLPTHYSSVRKDG